MHSHSVALLLLSCIFACGSAADIISQHYPQVLDYSKEIMSELGYVGGFNDPVAMTDFFKKNDNYEKFIVKVFTKAFNQIEGYKADVIKAYKGRGVTTKLETAEDILAASESLGISYTEKLF